MRIINWNLERPGLNSPKNAIRIQQILARHPDLALLTETSRAVALGADFTGVFTDPSPRKNRPGEAVAALWLRRSKFSVVQQIETTDPREAVCLELDSAAGPLLVYSSILPYHGYKGPAGTSASWEEHKKAIAWHRQDWLKLRAQFPHHPLITGGDYNQHRDGVGRYGTRDIRRLLTQALDDAGLCCVTEEDFVASGKLSRRNIDHICLTEALARAVTAVSAWEGTLDGIRLSDHNGIAVDLCNDLTWNNS